MKERLLWKVMFGSIIHSISMLITIPKSASQLSSHRRGHLSHTSLNDSPWQKNGGWQNCGDRTVKDVRILKVTVSLWPQLNILHSGAEIIEIGHPMMATVWTWTWGNATRWASDGFNSLRNSAFCRICQHSTSSFGWIWNAASSGLRFFMWPFDKRVNGFVLDGRFFDLLSGHFEVSGT